MQHQGVAPDRGRALSFPKAIEITLAVFKGSLVKRWEQELFMDESRPGSSTARFRNQFLWAVIVLFVAASFATAAQAQQDSATIQLSFIQTQTPDSNIEVAHSFDIDIDRNFSFGGFTGSANQLIIPRICIPFIGCSQEVRADTRTGARINGSLSFLNQLEQDFRIANSAFDPTRAEFTSRLTHRNGPERQGFRVVNERLDQSISQDNTGWIGLPSFDGAIKVTGDSLSQSTQRVLVLGQGLNTGFSVGPLDWDMDLFSVDTRLDPPLFESPWADAIPAFGAADLEPSVGGDFLYRRSFGPLQAGQPPGGARIPLWNIDLLSPLSHFDDRAVVKNNQVEHAFSGDVLRFGYDLAKSNPTLANLLVGTRNFGSNYRLDYDLFSATLGLALGYGEIVEIAPVLAERIIQIDRAAELRLSDGTLVTLAANQPYTVPAGQVLPELRTLDGAAAEMTVTLNSLPIDQTRQRVLRLSPMGNLTLLPRFVLQQRDGANWKDVKFLGLTVGVRGLAHLNLSTAFEIPLETSTYSGLEGLSPGQTIVSQFELRASGDTPGFNDGDGELPTVALTHPLTGAGLTVPQITSGTPSADLPLFQLPSGQTVSMNQLTDLELIVDDLQIKGFDLGSKLNSVFVGEGVLLSVLHADNQQPSRLGSLISDGTLWLRNDSGQTDMHLRRPGDLFLAGTGTTLIEGNALIDAPLTDEPSLFVIEPEHTLMMRGDHHVRIGVDLLPIGDTVLVNAPVQFINDGLVRIEANSNVDMNYDSVPGFPHRNSGRIEVDGASNPGAIYSSFTMSAAHGLEQEGVLEASDGGQIWLDGSSNPDNYASTPNAPWRRDLNLINDSASPALYRARDAGSRLVIGSRFEPATIEASLGRPIIQSGIHRFELVDNARYEGFVFGPILPDDALHGGTVEWFVDSGGAIELSGRSTLDGHLEIGEEGSMSFSGLHAQSLGGLSIDNQGHLAFASNASSLAPRPDLAPSFESEVIRINFEPPETTTPSGYLSDSGAVFGDRGNGFRYGWTGDLSSRARERENPASPDLVHDTLIHTYLVEPNVGSETWSIELPNGLYRVDILAGDPDFQNSNLQISANDALTVSGSNSPSQRWRRGEVFVSVTDELLVLDNAPGWLNNKICALIITPIDQLAGDANLARLENAASVELSGGANLALPTLATEFAEDGSRFDNGDWTLRDHSRLIVDLQRPRSDALAPIDDPNTSELPLTLTELAGTVSLRDRSAMLSRSEDQPDILRPLTQTLSRISG